VTLKHVTEKFKLLIKMTMKYDSVFANIQSATAASL